MLAEHNVAMGSHCVPGGDSNAGRRCTQPLRVTGLAQITEGVCSLGSSSLLLDLGCEELALCNFYLNSRLNFAKVICSAPLRRPNMPPVAANPLSTQLQVRLFRLHPAFVESLMGAEWQFGRAVATLPEVFAHWKCPLCPEHQLAFVVPEFVADLVSKNTWTSLPWHPRFRYEKLVQLTPGIPYRGVQCTDPVACELFPVNALSVKAAQDLLHPSAFLHAASLIQRWAPCILQAAEMESKEAGVESEASLQSLMQWLYASAGSGLQLHTTDIWGRKAGIQIQDRNSVPKHPAHFEDDVCAALATRAPDIVAHLHARSSVTRRSIVGR